MTIDIQTLASILIVLHAGSVVFMTFVLKRQYKLFNFDVTDNDSRFDAGDIRRIKRFRLGLFLLSCVVMLGNVIPIAIDAITIIGDNSIGRTPHVRTISIAYAVSNALTALISAYLINTLYRIAKGSHDPEELVEKAVSGK